MQDLAHLFREMDSGTAGMFLLGILLVLFLCLGALIFFLVTLQKTLESIAPDNRKMMPGLVWLMLIPYFHLVWLFILSGKIGDSLAAEFKRRNIVVFEERPGYGTGMAWAFVGLVSLLLGFAGTNMLSVILNIVWLTCGITYWVKIAGFRAKLAESGHWSQYAAPPVYPPYAPFPQHPYDAIPTLYPPVNPYAPPPQFPPQPYVNQPPAAPPYYPPPYYPSANYPPYNPAMPPPPFPPPYDPNDLSRWAPPAEPPKEKE